jgi:hypothetical protein
MELEHQNRVKNDSRTMPALLVNDQKTDPRVIDPTQMDNQWHLW